MSRTKLALTFVFLLCACLAMMYFLHVLSSRTLHVKLHSSEERFVAEALQNLVLVPDKLIPPETDGILNDDCYNCDCVAVVRNQKRKEKENAKKWHVHKEHASEENEFGKDALRQSQYGDVEDEEDKKKKQGQGQSQSQGQAKDNDAMDVVDPKEIWDEMKKKWEGNKAMAKVRERLASDEEFQRNIDIMKKTPLKRLSNFKNPCFVEKSRETTKCREGSFRHMDALLKKSNSSNPRDHQKLSCLPYFMVTGVREAMDIFLRLSAHSDVKLPLPSDSKWLQKTRFESKSCSSFETYTDFFTDVARTINSSHDEQGNHRMVTGEAALELFVDNVMWPLLPGNERQLQPRYTNADYLHHINPDLKVIIVVKDPVERVLSDYLDKNRIAKYWRSSMDFHLRARVNLDIVRKCLKTRPARTCVYDGTVETDTLPVRIRAGMYYILIEDWLRAFPRDQIYVINYNTFLDDKEKVLKDVISFLKLREATEEEMAKMISLDTHTLDDEDKDMEEPWEMRDTMREKLAAFYQTLNKKLAVLLGDESFLWQSQDLP